jgi:hypothetical protein
MQLALSEQENEVLKSMGALTSPQPHSVDDHTAQQMHAHNHMHEAEGFVSRAGYGDDSAATRGPDFGKEGGNDVDLDSKVCCVV